MFKKKPNKKITKFDSLVGQQSRFVGDLRFAGGLFIDGTLKGNVIADEPGESMVSVSDRGTVEGEVRVPNVRLHGIVTGDVYASEFVELGPTARVEGNVYYVLMEMAMGAEVNGKLVRMSEADRVPMLAAEERPSESIRLIDDAEAG